MSLRGRLLLLIGLTLLPAFGLMLIVGRIQHDAIRNEAERYALTLIQAQAANQIEMLNEAHVTLDLLARIPQMVQSGATCRNLLPQYADRVLARFNEIGIARADGKILCSMHKPGSRTIDHPIITDADDPSDMGFRLSNQGVSAQGGPRVLTALYPLANSQGRLHHILFATLPQHWFTNSVSQTPLPPGAFFTLLGHDRHVLARYPDSAQSRSDARALLERIQPHLGQATSWTGRTRLDGHEWAVTSTALDAKAMPDGPQIIVAIPLATAMRDAAHAFYWNLGVLAVFALAALAFAWYSGGMLILRPVRRLMGAADMIATGRYAVRTGIRTGPSEIIALGRAFDDMAGALEARIREDEIHRVRIARLNRIYRMLSAINGAIIRIRDRDQLLQETCRIVVEQGHFGFAWAGLIEQGSDILGLKAHAGDAGEFLDAIRVSLDPEHPEGRGLAGNAIRSGEPQIANHVEDDPRLTPWRRELNAVGIRSAAAFPLRVHGMTVGVLVLYAREHDYFDEQEITLLDELAADSSLGLEHIAKDQQISFLANWDTLTQLPNRDLFEDRLRQALHRAQRHRRHTAVLGISVVNQPAISDRMGRAVGDRLMLETASRLGALALERVPGVALTDHIARLGNHDFGLVISDLEGTGDLVTALRMIHTALAGSIVIGREAVDPDVRIGVAVYPRDAEDADTLVHHALFAAHVQTSSEQHRHTAFYSAGEDTAAQARYALEAALRTAIELQQFDLEYQPRIDARTGRIASAEALIRWQRPGHGRVPPNAFISVLEQTGLIVKVGEWAMQRALEQRLRMRDRLPDDFVISVNASSQELQATDYVARTRRLLRFTGARPEWLEIEITESGLVDSGGSTLEQLTGLKNLGVRLSIDDFGTGYSSLSYLRQFPVDALKIDQAFVREIGRAEDALLIVKSIIGLAKALNLSVIAEGVETAAQAQTLKQEGCDELQGFHFGRPLRAEAFEALFGPPPPPACA
ncbi:bifunctional diguanylate cyclase/phosphodiesterase [Acidihalobacter prosperus]|uniref:EAL domain-containing protein n=1 Tax=Acidihalobacter prosperus TaxID=160660 RepID=A0A1A6C4E9_9GAMM|nr:EAL domain-containing protein [Acidihalobacter prosperus]OBS09438.1 hypothetical protein Thpro_021766 [Acidihalobacter prosperus]